jgi:hypothetical protein
MLPKSRNELRIESSSDAIIVKRGHVPWVEKAGKAPYFI